jgi:hypothetical protein
VGADLADNRAMRTGREAPMVLGGSDRPVFLDESGRRARWVRWATRGMSALMPAWLVAVLLGALTPLSLPALSLEAAALHAPKTEAASPAPTAGARSAPVSSRESPTKPIVAAAVDREHGSGGRTRTVAYAALTSRFGSGRRARAATHAYRAPARGT